MQRGKGWRGEEAAFERRQSVSNQTASANILKSSVGQKMVKKEAESVDSGCRERTELKGKYTCPRRPGNLLQEGISK